MAAGLSAHVRTAGFRRQRVNVLYAGSLKWI